jgi:hypothetical protein
MRVRSNCVNEVSRGDGAKSIPSRALGAKEQDLEQHERRKPTAFYAIAGELLSEGGAEKGEDAVACDVAEGG